MPRRKSPEVEKRILSALEKGPLTFNELLNETGIPKATLYRYLEDLRKRGLIEKTEKGWILGREALKMRVNELLEALKIFLNIDESCIRKLKSLLENGNAGIILKSINLLKEGLKRGISRLEIPMFLKLFVDFVYNRIPDKIDAATFMQLINYYKFHKSLHLISESIRKTEKTPWGKKLNEVITPLKLKGEKTTYSEFILKLLAKYEKTDFAKLYRNKEYQALFDKLSSWIEECTTKDKLVSYTQDLIGILRILDKSYGYEARNLVETILQLGSSLLLSGPRTLTEREVELLISTIDKFYEAIIKNENRSIKG